MSFAKVFESPKYGQIVAILKGDDLNRPEIRFFFNPPGLGVCETGIGYKESEWEKAEQVFAEKVDFSLAEKIVGEVFQQIGALEIEQQGGEVSDAQ